MPIEQYTYWSVTINNPDENDYVLVRNPNPKYIRELVWTPEVGGEKQTPHIQAWVRLQRNQSMSFLSKLYPRGHFKHCDKDVYNENCHQYAQKNDETTAGNHHITLNDPLPANDTLLYQVLQRSFERLIETNKDLRDHFNYEGAYDVIQRICLKQLDTTLTERLMVTEKSGLEKIFCSPAYDRMKQKFWKEILMRLNITQDAIHSEGSTQTEVEGSQGEDGDSYEESETSHSERSSEGRSIGSSSSDDFQEGRKQVNWKPRRR